MYSITCSFCNNLSPSFLLTGIDHDVEVESVVIIVFVSLIVILLFFAGLYFYYVRGGKQKVETFITEHKRLVPKFGGSSSSSDSSAPNRKTGIRRPSLPTMPHWTPPTMPKMPLKMPHVSFLRWSIKHFSRLCSNLT